MACRPVKIRGTLGGASMAPRRASANARTTGIGRSVSSDPQTPGPCDRPVPQFLPVHGRAQPLMMCARLEHQGDGTSDRRACRRRPPSRCDCRWRWPIGARRRVLLASHESVLRNPGRRASPWWCLAAQLGVAATFLSCSMELPSGAADARRDIVLPDARRGARLPRGLRSAVCSARGATSARLTSRADRRVLHRLCRRRVLDCARGCECDGSVVGA